MLYYSTCKKCLSYSYLCIRLQDIFNEYHYYVIFKIKFKCELSIMNLLFNNIYIMIFGVLKSLYVEVKRTERCSVSRLNFRSGASKVDRVNAVEFVEFKYNCLLNKIE